MVSSRARVGRNLGTRLNDHEMRLASAEVKSRTAPVDYDERVASLESKVSQLASPNYRAEEDLSVRGSDTIRALLDPTYEGPGPARVTFLDVDGAIMSEEAYQWLTPYTPSGNRVVTMQRVGGTWHILGHNGEEYMGGKVRASMETALVSYRSYHNDPTWSEPLIVQRLHSGIVLLSGLATVEGSGLIATLPEGYRPDTRIIVPVENNDTRKSLTIEADGRILTRGTFVIPGYLSFDGIAFPAAGVADWTPIGSTGSEWQNGWGAYDPAAWGTPAYWQDNYGVVWFRGLVARGTTAADTTMFLLPEGLRPLTQTHVSVANMDVFGSVSAMPGVGGGVKYKGGNAGNSWLSLGNLTVIAEPAEYMYGWYAPGKSNGWVHYGDTFPDLWFWRREDGLCMGQGLIRNGTFGTTMTTLPDHMIPPRRLLLGTVSGGGRGRTDLFGIRDSVGAGRVHLSQGTTSWFSFDGTMWMV